MNNHDLPHTNVHHFLEQSCHQRPDKTALVHNKKRYSYLSVNEAANRVAHYLLSRGFTSGGRAILLCENSFEYVAGYYGVLKAGGTVIPLSTDIPQQTLNCIAAELKPEALIIDAKYSALAESLDPNLCVILARHKTETTASTHRILWEALAVQPAYDPEIVVGEEALASIVYTSGSTGKPKGVMLSHRNIVSNTHAICSYLELTAEDIQMVVLPFFYVMGKSLLNTHFAVGGTVVINTSWLYPAAVINQLVEERVTGFSGVPSTFAYLVYRSPLAQFRDKLVNLRYCSQAGGHMARQLKVELKQALPAHTKVFIMYGATEASARLTYLDPSMYTAKMDSIGKAIPGVTTAILDESGQVVKPGESGELAAAGPNIMVGYWNDPETTARVIDSRGFYHTGDHGYCDEEGYIFLSGRKDNMLKVSGHRINTQEVEDALVGTGLVLEALVLGLPDKLAGAKLVAVVEAKDGSTTEEKILMRCRELLARYKVPQQVLIVKSIPKKLNGKLDRERSLALVIQHQSSDTSRPDRT